MRYLILIALMFAFTIGGLSDMAHASASDHTCVHHQIDQDDSVDNEPCHSEQDQSQCEDCCCIHSHVIATSGTSAKIAINVNNENITALADRHYSAELSSLKRPPRL